MAWCLSVAEFISRIRDSGVAVLGAGGAGDIISAYVMCRVLEDLFGVESCVPVALLWERWVKDPFPGPVPRDAVKGARVGKCVWVSKDTYVERPGNYVFRPNAAVVAEVFGREVPAFTLEDGVLGAVECLEEVRESGYSHLMALDVGGDILARGWEPSLWSPLADAASVAAVSHFSDSSVAILAPGADGELPADYVLKRIEEVMRRGGYLGAIGLWRDHLRIYEEILPKATTEAGKAAYHALRGEVGEVTIREGSRTIKIGPHTPITHVLETNTVMEITVLPQAIKHTKTLNEALNAAHKAGIVTELDLELTIAKLYGTGPQTKPNWLKAKQEAHKTIIHAKEQNTKT